MLDDDDDDGMKMMMGEKAETRVEEKGSYEDAHGGGARVTVSGVGWRCMEKEKQASFFQIFSSIF